MAKGHCPAPRTKEGMLHRFISKQAVEGSSVRRRTHASLFACTRDASLYHRRGGPLRGNADLAAGLVSQQPNGHISRLARAALRHRQSNLLGDRAFRHRFGDNLGPLLASNQHEFFRYELVYDEPVLEPR
jgi:hypothetical protein